jgi:hypothetical protein
MTQFTKHAFALVVALAISAATFHETTRVPVQSAPGALVIA